MLGGDNFSLDYPDKDIHFQTQPFAVESKSARSNLGRFCWPFF